MMIDKHKILNFKFKIFVEVAPPLPSTAPPTNIDKQSIQDPGQFKKHERVIIIQ